MNGGVWIANTVQWTRRMTSVHDVEPRIVNIITKKKSPDGKTKILSQKWRKYGKVNDTRYQG